MPGKKPKERQRYMLRVNDTLLKYGAYGPERTIILQNRLIWMN